MKPLSNEYAIESKSKSYLIYVIDRHNLAVLINQ